MTEKAKNQKGRYGLYYYGLLYSANAEYPFSVSAQNEPTFFDKIDDAKDALRLLRKKGLLVGSVWVAQWVGNEEWEFELVWKIPDED